MSGFALRNGTVLDQIPRLVMTLIGAGNCPGVPLCSLAELIETLARLANREIQVRTATAGLTNTYTIGGTTAKALQFLFATSGLGRDYEELSTLLKNDPESIVEQLIRRIALKVPPPAAPLAAAGPPPLTGLPLETATQWGISWTTYAGVYERAAEKALDEFAAALDPARADATTQFWPTIAKYGLAYNLLILQKVTAATLPDWKNLFAPVWGPTWGTDGASLYAIDLRLFETLPVDTTHQRFTPATVTLLQQDPATKALIPIAVRVSAHAGSQAQFYVGASPAWLYALEAARTSITVYGIWLGHVYQWHIITAAMQLAMRDTLPTESGPTPAHPILQLLGPQLKYLIGFDVVLLLLWSQAAPPTSVATPFGFLQLLSTFATGRGYFMDDPPEALSRFGITEQDFTQHTAWDQYPIVGTYLAVWKATETYVSTFVDATYPPSHPPSADAALQSWIQKAANRDAGNVQGLPHTINTNEVLKQVLTSLLYRITIHGSSRLLSSANPGLTFVANYPPCLQNATIPPPTTPMSSATLFSYLPVTGTIGEMVRFYYTFSFSRPYESFIPEYGVESNLFFPNGLSDPRNVALVQYRRQIQELIDQLSKVSPPNESQRYQWPLSIET